MKTKSLLILLSLIHLIQGLMFSQWYRQESGTTEALNDVICLNKDTVFAVGNSGIILKTTNGGENWISKNSGFTNSILKVRFSDDNIGYAVGLEGVIKTYDCGETWEILNVIENDIYSVSCVNSDTVFICGANGLIKKTEDGGITWTSQITGISETVTNIQFVNDTLGYATAGTPYEDNYFLKTCDYGQNWQSQHLSLGGIFALFFCNDTIGFISSSSLFKTNNGGENWIETDYIYWSNIYSILCLSPDLIWVSGWEAFNDEGGVVANSLTGGIGDDAFSYVSGYHEFYNSIYFANDTTGYAVGFVNNDYSGFTGGLIIKNSTGNNINQIDNIQNNNLYSIYPNPSEGIFTLETSESPALISVWDITGKELFRTETSKTINRIDLSNYNDGLYFILIKTGHQEIIKKVVIS